MSRSVENKEILNNVIYQMKGFSGRKIYINIYIFHIFSFHFVYLSL